MKLDILMQELEGIHDDFKLIPVKEIEVAEWVWIISMLKLPPSGVLL